MALYPTSIPWMILLAPAITFWSNIFSTASPLPIHLEPDYESISPTNDPGPTKPLACHENITGHQWRQETFPLSYSSRAFFQGNQFCNDTLICTGDWLDLNGTLTCNGELFRNGTLGRNRAHGHPACLPGLNKLPTPVLSIMIVLLVVISGGLSGLKSAFMSLDPIDLRAIMDKGTIRERELAGRIHEARQHSEFTTLFLCAMTLATVMINHSLPLMAACLLNNHLWGFLLSSVLVIIFGEILPLMVFPRFPLLALGNMMWAIYTVSCLLCVPACILSYIYEFAVTPKFPRSSSDHHDKGVGYLADLRTTPTEIDGDLSDNATRVLHGIIDMEKRVARDIMRPIAEVKMKSSDSRMTLHSWTEISDWGYSRVPIYTSLDYNKDNSVYSDCNIKVMGFLHVFDLLLVIPDEASTLKGLPIHKMPVVSEEYPLWDLLHLFQQGASHMAIVEKCFKEIEISESFQEFRPSKSLWKIAKDKYRRVQRKLCSCHSKQSGVKTFLPHHAPKYWTDDNEYLLSRGRTIGIITLEDVLETLIQSRIFDEKDISLGLRTNCVENALDISRTIDSCPSEQVLTLDPWEPPEVHGTGGNIPHIDPTGFHVDLNAVGEVGSCCKIFPSPNNTQTSPLLSPHAQRHTGKRRVSFPESAPGGDETPHLGLGFDIFDEGNFRSKTFPRNKAYTRVNTELPLLRQPIDILGLICDEETDLKTGSESKLETRD